MVVVGLVHMHSSLVSFTCTKSSLVSDDDDIKPPILCERFLRKFTFAPTATASFAVAVGANVNFLSVILAIVRNDPCRRVHEPSYTGYFSRRVLHTYLVQKGRVAIAPTATAKLWDALSRDLWANAGAGAENILMLGQVENSPNIPGVLKQHDNTIASRGKVSWSDVVRRNLWVHARYVCIPTFIEIWIQYGHGP